MQNMLSSVRASEPACSTGYAGSVFHRAQKDVVSMGSQFQESKGDLTCLMAQLRDLKAEVEHLRAERDRLSEIQTHVLELLGTDRPDRLVHDLRNVLNERALFRALAETVM